MNLGGHLGGRCQRHPVTLDDVEDLEEAPDLVTQRAGNRERVHRGERPAEQEEVRHTRQRDAPVGEDVLTPQVVDRHAVDPGDVHRAHVGMAVETGGVYDDVELVQGAVAVDKAGRVGPGDRPEDHVHVRLLDYPVVVGGFRERFQPSW